MCKLSKDSTKLKQNVKDAQLINCQQHEKKDINFQYVFQSTCLNINRRFDQLLLT